MRKKRNVKKQFIFVFAAIIEPIYLFDSFFK